MGLHTICLTPVPHGLSPYLSGSGHSLTPLLQVLVADMTKDVSRYVKTCSVYAISQTPCHLPADKLVTLPIPNVPHWH